MARCGGKTSYPQGSGQATRGTLASAKALPDARRSLPREPSGSSNDRIHLRFKSPSGEAFEHLATRLTRDQTRISASDRVHKPTVLLFATAHRGRSTADHPIEERSAVDAVGDLISKLGPPATMDPSGGD